MRDVVIDTDAASLLQRRLAPPWVLRHLAGARIWLTFITVGELANWAVMRNWDEHRRGRLDAWTARRPVIPYDARIAQLWGELAGQAQLRGRPRPQNHAWIAACCLRYQLPLVALNPAGFGDFAEHHGLVLLDDRTLDQAAGRAARRRVARRAAVIRPRAMVARAEASRVPRAPSAATTGPPSPSGGHPGIMQPQLWLRSRRTMIMGRNERYGLRFNVSYVWGLISGTCAHTVR